MSNGCQVKDKRGSNWGVAIFPGLVLAALLYPNKTLAQQTQVPGSLVVTTHTLQGQAVPKAAITVAPVAGSPPTKTPPRSIETSASGEARFTDLIPGRYRVTIQAKGFDELTTDLDVEAGSQSPAAIEAILTTGGSHTDSVTVQGVIDTPLEEANTPAVLERQQVKNLPDRPRTVSDALPLAPGIVRLPNGQLRLSGSGEHRSALLVDSATATDPATGQFGATVPIDSVRTMNVLSSPFLAEYGGFTADVVSVETRKGGDKWTFELNDPLPNFAGAVGTWWGSVRRHRASASVVRSLPIAFLCSSRFSTTCARALSLRFRFQTMNPVTKATILLPRSTGPLILRIS